MNPHQIKSLLLAIVLPAVLHPGICVGQAPQAGDLVFETHTYERASGEAAEYQVGTFHVHENRRDAESRVIGIGFCRIPAPDSSAPPVFFLPGGPGSSYLDDVTSVLDDSGGPLIARELLGRCDLVFVDQRGFSDRGVMLDDRSFTRRSARPDADLGHRIEEFTRFAREVVARYAETDVDLRGYSILECIEDVHELRAALGYEKIALCGQSFGSQWSFGILRMHPDTVERALLTGVEPLNSGYDMPSYVFNAVRRMWKSIDDDERFTPYLPPGGMAEAAEVVATRLAEESIPVFGVDQSHPIRILGPDDFPWNDPVAVLELYHGRLEDWADPRRPRIVPRTLIQPLIDSSLGATPARRERLWNDPAIRYVSRSNFAPLMATAQIWPSPDVGDDFRMPVVCDVPVVFVNGDWDVKTPVENMHEIAPYFPRGHPIVVHRCGHGTMTAATRRQHPKFIGQLAGFLETGDREGLPHEVTVRPTRTFRAPGFGTEPSSR